MGSAAVSAVYDVRSMRMMMGMTVDVDEDEFEADEARGHRIVSVTSSVW
jgi:hypothetical protein